MTLVHPSPLILSPAHPQKNQLSSSELSAIRGHIFSGGLIGLPTETVYGLAAPIDREESVRLIFSIKNRPFFDPLIVHCAEVDQIWPLIDCDQATHELIRKVALMFWPGPLTIVVKASALIHPLINNGLGTVGVRIPRHPIAIEILKTVGPMAAPSANQFGMTSPTTAEHVVDSFAADTRSTSVLVVDGGPCQVGLESTVIEINSPTQCTLLRPGGIGPASLEKHLQIEVLRQAPPRQKRTAPGLLDTHYQPHKPLFTFQHNTIAITTDQAQSALSSDLRYRDSAHDLKWVQLSAEPLIAARELYSLIRSADQSSSRAIGLLLPPRALIGNDEIWLAIADRLSRARTAHFNLENQ